MQRVARILLAVGWLVLSGCGDTVPTAPSQGDLNGTWTGTGTYPNTPFTLTLIQSGTTLRGTYRDQLDQSLAVGGTFTAPAFAIVIDFGDAKLNLEGTIVDGRTARGDMFTSALGNRRFPFTMTR